MVGQQGDAARRLLVAPQHIVAAAPVQVSGLAQLAAVHGLPGSVGGGQQPWRQVPALAVEGPPHLGLQCMSATDALHCLGEAAHVMRWTPSAMQLAVHAWAVTHCQQCSRPTWSAAASLFSSRQRWHTAEARHKSLGPRKSNTWPARSQVRQVSPQPQAHSRQVTVVYMQLLGHCTSRLQQQQQ